MELLYLFTAYDESTLSKHVSYEWYKAFKSCRDVMVDCLGHQRLQLKLISQKWIRNSQRKLNLIPETALKNLLMIGLFVGISVSFLKKHTLKVIK